MKRGVKEAFFCPERALILNHITISLGKFDRSQWDGFEKEGVACWVLLPRRLAVMQPKNLDLKTKTMGDDNKVVSGHHRDGWTERVIRHSHEQSPAPHLASPEQSLILPPWVILSNLDSCCLIHYRQRINQR